MTEQLRKDTESVCISCAFSPDYVSQLTPFRPRTSRVPVLERTKYNTQESIATPDEGKRARLLKARI